MVTTFPWLETIMLRAALSGAPFSVSRRAALIFATTSSVFKLPVTSALILKTSFELLLPSPNSNLKLKLSEPLKCNCVFVGLASTPV